MHDARLIQRRAEAIKLALPEVPQLEPTSFRETQRLACPRLIGIELSAPDDHIVGLGRCILVQLRQTLGGDDAGIAAFASLAHQAHYRFG